MGTMNLIHQSLHRAQVHVFIAPNLQLIAPNVMNMSEFWVILHVSSVKTYFIAA